MSDLVNYSSSDDQEPRQANPAEGSLTDDLTDEELEKLVEQARTFVGNLSVRSSVCVLALRTSSQLFHLARGILIEEAGKYIKEEAERERFIQFVQEVYLAEGNQPVKIEKIQDNLRTAIAMTEAEINESYEHYREFHNYRPPIAVTLADEAGPHVYAIERGNFLITAGTSKQLALQLQAVEANLRSQRVPLRVLRLALDNSLPAKVTPKAGEELLIYRRPLSVWKESANRDSQLRRLLEMSVQSLSGRGLDVLLVDDLSQLYTREVPQAHKSILQSAAAYNSLKEIARKYNCIVVAGLPLEVTPDDTQWSQTKSLIEEQFQNTTIHLGTTHD